MAIQHLLHGAVPRRADARRECPGPFDIRIRNGDQLFEALSETQNRVVTAGFELDYLEARHAETLAPVGSPADGPMRLLIAARIGGTRLIDNIAV